MTDPHRECWELLPWLVNERLSREDAARLGKHLAECAQCRAELDSQRQLREAMRNEDALVLAPQASLQKLMQRIDTDEHEDEAAPEVEVAAPRSQPAARVVARPRWLAIAASVQAVAITGLLAALVWQSTPSPDEPAVAPAVHGGPAPFGTLTAHGAAVVPGPVLRMVFDKDATVTQMNELLDSIDAQIIAGPSKGMGVLTLALGSTHDDASAEELAQRLRKNRLVSFAEVAMVEVPRQ